MQILSLIIGIKVIPLFTELISLAEQKQFVIISYFTILLLFTCLFEACIPYFKSTSCSVVKLQTSEFYLIESYLIMPIEIVSSKRLCSIILSECCFR
jgi:hypothetical protein